MNEPIGIFNNHECLDIGYVQLLILSKHTYNGNTGKFLQQAEYTVKNLTTDQFDRLTEQQLIKLYYGE